MWELSDETENERDSEEDVPPTQLIESPPGSQPVEEASHNSPPLIRKDANAHMLFGRVNSSSVSSTGSAPIPMPQGEEAVNRRRGNSDASFLRRNATVTEATPAQFPKPDGQANDPETLFPMSFRSGSSGAKQ